MRIGYIVHNLNDPAVERRCVMLENGGARVDLAGFCRDAAFSDAIAAREPHLLGETQDSAMLQRALGTLRSAVFHGPLERYWERCDVIVARNLEQLSVALAVVGQRPLVYECLDIHRTLVGAGLAARAVQAVEARMLPRVDLLLTSSPAFVDNHFAATTLNCPIELVENKLLVDSVSDFPQPRQSAPAERICIGWFGMLRCRKTLEVLKDMASAMPEKVEVLIAGKPSPAIFPDFEAAIGGHPGITYTGPYRYADLPDLYGRCHFSWTIDWFEEGENSSWLLPNRIYESIAHGCVPIALEEIEVGRWLAGHGAGLRVAQADAIGKILAKLTASDMARYQTEVMSVPRAAVLADDSDCRELVQLLGAARRR
jgi:succinoglycan biosynthesis protein ExoL